MGLQTSPRVQVPPAHHTELLNYLAKKIGAQSYLEIGVQRSLNFNKIEIEDKIGVDPDPLAMATCIMTSDRFFEMNKKRFDLVFIDGLHHAEQVEKDFNNSILCLNEGGLIVMHDTAPESEHLTRVPRDKKGRWLGDVYKFVCHLNEEVVIDFRTLDFDNGCTVAWKVKNDYDPKIGKKGRGQLLFEVTWETYIQNKERLLRMTTYAQLENILIQR